MSFSNASVASPSSSSGTSSHNLPAEPEETVIVGTEQSTLMETVDEPRLDEGPQRTHLAPHFEDVSLDDLVTLIADLLERIIALNDQIPPSHESLTRFHSRSPPSISVLEYLRRVIRYIPRIEHSVLLLSLYYIDRIRAKLPSFTVSSLTVHRFLLAAITVGSKAFCDAFATNPLFAKVGGVSLVELNVLEREFLSVLDWRLACSRELLQAYYVQLARTHSSGLYYVPDAPPRPLRIDTLRTDKIDWTIPTTSQSALGAAHIPVVESEGDSSASSSDDEDTHSIAQLQSSTSSRRSNTTQAPGSLPASTSTSQSVSSNSMPRQTRPTGSSSHNSPVPVQTNSISHVISINSNPASAMPSPPVPAGRGTPAPRGFRSPMVGRRRRRSSINSAVVNSPKLDIMQFDFDVTAVEGALRGSSRRRLDIEGSSTSTGLGRHGTPLPVVEVDSGKESLH